MSQAPRRPHRPHPTSRGRTAGPGTNGTRPARLRRRALGGLAGALALLAGTAAVPAAQAAAPGAASPAGAQAGAAASPAPASDLPAGLFGRGDPQFDGVFRQSIALLAQRAAGYTPAPEAVDWLLGQQCEDGSFLSYRADPEQPCTDVTAADSNATALAVQALAALGGQEQEAAAERALTWLAGVQNEDGGWSYNPGAASDTNSTAAVIGAFVAAGRDPAEVRREGHSPYDALAAFQLGCDAAEADRGAFAWQPDPESGALIANDAATVDAVLASYGSGLLVEPGGNAAPVAPLTGLACGGDQAARDPDGAGDGAADTGAAGAGAPDSPDQAGAGEQLPAHLTSAAAGAARLAEQLTDGGGYLATELPGAEGGQTEGADGESAAQPDFGTTAEAVIALAAGGNEEAWQDPLQWLIENHASWPDYAASPAAVGTLVLAAHATGVAPDDFGGTDLIAQLNALGPAPDGGAGTGEAAGQAEEDGTGLAVLLWVVGVGLVAGVGIGLLLSTRRRRKAS